MEENQTPMHPMPLNQIIGQLGQLAPTDRHKILLALSHFIPDLQDNLTQEETLKGVRKLVHDINTRRTEVVAQLKRLLDDASLSPAERISKITETVDHALQNPVNFKIWFITFYMDHPDTTALYRKIYNLCTNQEWTKKTTDLLSNPRSPQE
jgi:hypothetical protein